MGKKGVKKAALDAFTEPLAGQVIMRVVALRGSNLVEVENGQGEKTLCMMPAKFSKNLWIKRGNYVLVDEGDKKKVMESNAKVTGTIAQVLYEHLVKALLKTSFWPQEFAPVINSEIEAENPIRTDTSDEEDNLPALQANPNRRETTSSPVSSSSSSSSASECED